MVRYVMISSEVRGDLEKPLGLFRSIEVHHLYRKAPWNDLRPEDFGPLTRRYRTPWDLYRHLARIKPAVIQGPEPLSLLMFPFLIATYAYLARHPQVPLIAMSQETVALDRKYGLLARVMKPMLRRWFRRASTLLWLDESSRRNMVNLGAEESKLRYMLYGSWGVDFSLFAPEGPRVDYGPGPTILHVGRLVPEKGAEYLVEAFRLLRNRGVDCRLAIVGDGPRRQFLEQQVQASGWANDIQFWGGQKFVDLPPFFRGATVLVLPGYRSRFWVQHISLTAWEAMRCGLPVITTDIGEMRFYAPPETGVVVPERNAAALASEIQTLLGDRERLNAMKQGAYRYATATFDIRRNVASAEQLIQELAGTR